jgi:hypothetical protein
VSAYDKHLPPTLGDMLVQAAIEARDDLEEALDAYLRARYVGVRGEFYGPALRTGDLLAAIDALIAERDSWRA